MEETIARRLRGYRRVLLLAAHPGAREVARIASQRAHVVTMLFRPEGRQVFDLRARSAGVWAASDPDPGKRDAALSIASVLCDALADGQEPYGVLEGVTEEHEDPLLALRVAWGSHAWSPWPLRNARELRVRVECSEGNRNGISGRLESAVLGGLRVRADFVPIGGAVATVTVVAWGFRDRPRRQDSGRAIGPA
ncbi:MAG: hypothetical protein ACOZNI_20815 [Myxococcota bacterium]